MKICGVVLAHLALQELTAVAILLLQKLQNLGHLIALSH